MSKSKPSYQECCLYFTANSLTRYISTMADEAFRITGLSASYAHLMLLLIDEPGLGQNELSKRINVKASTMTRFVDKLIMMRYVERKQEGRNVFVYPTEEGINLKPKIDEALSNLFDTYCKVLGKDFAIKLTSDIHKANEMLNESS
ncbi:MULTISPECIES: MarR family winged helix-turn-helix transcriptional regulator [unclassified Tenacibaculum]|uniref:MarR family winged helix-turn-helix transcriptional regulator n=1 Tax=unclassified Tenacibaculum TaxID=2635139 RepID=UPI001F45CAD1|nr:MULTISPECIES: MarR family transcriptional regulator [unclassified Tenacibaculum]MCF2875229.1 MarR family transcriptional regulator [Tenacibaculum sp. Cn5-1]MCF2935305.1 MarR family transcriptional regulator [Tenacibaculum sp. Cn5-34]MCG7511253.1 MarR family transcriptional regulator [Tenacibaculum sp. Cn5-46]